MKARSKAQESAHAKGSSPVKERVVEIPPMSEEQEEWEASLPRSIEREGLIIVDVRDDGRIIISNSERMAPYVFYKGERLKRGIFAWRELHGSPGYFMEVNISKLCDGERTGFYVPEGADKWDKFELPPA